MKLFIIQTAFGTYATNGNDSNEVTQKFKKEYDCLLLDIISITEIKVEELSSIKNNEDIVFF